MGKFEKAHIKGYRALKDSCFDAHIDRVTPKCVFGPKRGNLGVNPLTAVSSFA